MNNEMTKALKAVHSEQQIWHWPEVHVPLGFPSGSGKQSTCTAGAEGDEVQIPGSGRSPEKGHGNHSSVLAWRIPWTEEPGGLQSMGS